LDGDFGRGGGAGGRGFGEWNQEREDKVEKDKEVTEKDEKREERRRDRKSRWGARDEEPEQGEQIREGGQVNGQENRDDGGLEAHDAPKTPPEEFDQNESVAPTVSNNEDLIPNENNLAQQHIDIVENRSSAAHDEGSGNHENFEQMNQTNSEISETHPVPQVNQGLSDSGQEGGWPEPSNEELPPNNQSESSVDHQMQPSDDTAINRSEETSAESSEQPAYDLLGDLGAVVAPTFNNQSGENDQEAE